MTNIIRPPCDEGVIRSGRARSPCNPNAELWILAATILGSSMAFIDGTVVNVALPAIQRQLGASGVEAQWIVESYALFVAALTLVGGSLGDHFGRRRIFSLGVVLFTLASTWCGFSQSPMQLIIARAVQGVGGALLIPGSLAIISASFEQARRGKAIGTWSGFTGITAVLGPVLGGFLVENLSWRWAFFINIPLATAVLAITLTHVPESRDEQARRMDLRGAILAVVGLGGLVFGLIESSKTGFSDPLVIGAMVLGAAALLAFVGAEYRSAEPMMPLSMFRSRNFTGANVFTLLMYFALGGALYYFPFVLIQVQGYSATAAGAAFAPAIVLMFFLTRYTGGLTDRFGARLPLIIGPAIAAGGFALFTVPGLGSASYWTSYFPAVLALGLGLSILVPTLTTVALNAVSGHHSGLASGVNNAFSRTASLLAIAVLGVLMFACFSNGLDADLAKLDLSPAALQQMESEKVELSAARPPKDVGKTVTVAIERAVDRAFLSGFRVLMLTAAGLALASSLAAALLIEGKNSGGENKMPKASESG